MEVFWPFLSFFLSFWLLFVNEKERQLFWSRDFVSFGIYIEIKLMFGRNLWVKMDKKERINVGAGKNKESKVMSYTSHPVNKYLENRFSLTCNCQLLCKYYEIIK